TYLYLRVFTARRMLARTHSIVCTGDSKTVPLKVLLSNLCKVARSRSDGIRWSGSAIPRMTPWGLDLAVTMMAVLTAAATVTAVVVKTVAALPCLHQPQPRYPQKQWMIQ